MYDFDTEPGKVFHNKCEKKTGEDRKCEKTTIDLIKEWPMFFNGKFVIIPEEYFL